MPGACQPPTASSARLLFVTGTAASVRLGSGTYVGIAALRRALQARGHEVELIAAPAVSAAAWRRLWFNYRLRNQVAAADWDVIVGFDLDGVFLGASGVRSIASIKGVLAEELRFERGTKRASLRLQSYLEGHRVRQADRVIATSQYAAKAIERHYGVPPARIRVVPELIDLRAWRARLDLARPKFRSESRILCVAHLYPRKDVAILIHALVRMRSPTVLRIVGTGPELGRLRSLARKLGVADRVHFLEHLSLARLAEEYRAADVFCLPSRQEGFGIVLLEAMAAGLPIVAARAAAIPEVVPEGECGWLFEPGDAEALAALLDQLLDDPAACQRLGSAGQRHVARYDANAVAAQFLDAIGLAEE